ncbi:hypothetical protein R8G64_07620 [Tenacibaculum maritimum]
MSNTNVNISGYNFEFNDELDLWEVFVNNYQIYLNKDFRRDYGGSLSKESRIIK